MGVTSAVFDVSLARGLAYYTGTVYEAFQKDGALASSLAGGGRWDAMIGKFLGGSREIPAVGVAFGLEPIMDTLRLREEFKEKTPARVYVIPIKTIPQSLRVVRQLRKNGINADIDISERSISKNLDYANALGIPYVVIVGERELAKKKVLLRNMETGKEQTLTVRDVIKKLA
jgi:histidyl-tRNA synthetase